MIAAIAATTGLQLIVLAAILAGLSGLPALIATGRGRGLSAAGAVASSALGLIGVGLTIGGEARSALPWPILGDALAFGVDGLSALFLVLIFLIFGLGSIYALAYWRPGRSEQGRSLPLPYGSMAAGVVLLLIARNGVLFLFGFEVMAVSAFFLVATEHRKQASREAAWIYLATTHAGMSCLFAAFALLRSADGSWDWDPATIGALSPGRSLLVFVLLLLGFGMKAGVMPLHFWLPAAHAKAPSHVSAILSGVMLKTGAYGLVRLTGLMPALPTWCGALVLGLGAVTALLGVAACLGQGDLKRLLAYSSIENLGIVFLGLGLALIGRAEGEATWITLGLGGALLHVLNHSLFKPLLFLAAGSVIHATGTHRIEAMGGLWKAMPRTAIGFLCGACAISGLPVWNGFVGELLLYLGLFRAAMSDHAALALLAGAGIATLAMVGTLAVAAFVRAFATVFLGTPRSEAARHAHEAPRAMTGVLGFLALACTAIGMLPFWITPLVDGAVAATGHGVVTPIAELAPMHALGLVAIVTTALVIGSLWRLLRRRADAATVGTWDCGYADPGSPRVQYTGSSFAQYVLRMLAWATPRRRTPAPPQELFPGPQRFESETREPLLHGLLLPWCSRWADRCLRLRILQYGSVQLYVAYVLAVLLLLLCWSVVDTAFRG